MKLSGIHLLSFAAPMLVLISIVGLIHRQDSNRLQSLPAFLVGSGLVVSGAFLRRRRRADLLMSLKKMEDDTL